MKIHVCLVSAQAAANLLPALDPVLKPEQVILVVTKKMALQASHLKNVLGQVGIRVEALTLSDEHDYARMEAELLDLASRLDGKEVTLNITGGTKMMSLAAQKVATAADWTMFYIDADTDSVIWLRPDAQPKHALTEHLRLPHYLQGYGFTLAEKPQRMQVSPEQQRLTSILIRQSGDMENPLSTLNWLAQQAESKQQLTVTMDNKQRDSRSLYTLLRHFTDSGSLTVEGDNIRFGSEADRDFVKGGWLEAHVFHTLAGLGKELGIRDKASNLEVTDATGVKNELDVAFMARNRLFVIECKTARMDKPEAPKANDALFKLAETSKRIGGLGTRGMLASYRGLRDSEKRLAGALGIELVCGAELIRLDEKLKIWVG